jgi:hypothetical protein
MPETEETLDKRIEHFENMSVWHRYLDARPMPIDITSLTPEEVAAAQKKAKTQKLTTFRSNILIYADKYEVEVLGEFEQFDSRDMPIASLPEDHKACVLKMTMSDLKDEFKNQRAEIDRIGPVCDNLASNWLRPEVQAAVDKGEEFPIILANPVGETLQYYIAASELPDFQRRMRERIEILQEAKKIRQEVFAIYEAELKSRESRSSRVVESAIKEIDGIVKEAERLQKIIVKAAEKCRKSGVTDPDAAELFVICKDKLRELEGRYVETKQKVSDVAVWQEVASKFPLFPAAPQVSCGEETIRTFAHRNRILRDHGY